MVPGAPARERWRSSARPCSLGDGNRALVQICAGSAARPEEEWRLCGENRIPDCWGSLVLEMETPQVELSFANTVEQFDTGDGGCCAIKVLEAEHRPCSGFNTAVILFDEIVQVLR